MPPTTIVANSMPGSFSTTGQVLTATAIDVANGNDVLAAENLFLLVHNSGASSRTFTITSQPDAVTGRTGNVSVSIAAGEKLIFRLTKNGWANGDGKVVFGGNHAELIVSIVKM